MKCCNVDTVWVENVPGKGYNFCRECRKEVTEEVRPTKTPFMDIYLEYARTRLENFKPADRPVELTGGIPSDCMVAPINLEADEIFHLPPSVAKDLDKARAFTDHMRRRRLKSK